MSRFCHICAVLLLASFHDVPKICNYVTLLAVMPFKTKTHTEDSLTASFKNARSVNTGLNDILDLKSFKKHQKLRNLTCLYIALKPIQVDS